MGQPLFFNHIQYYSKCCIPACRCVLSTRNTVGVDRREKSSGLYQQIYSNTLLWPCVWVFWLSQFWWVGWDGLFSPLSLLISGSDTLRAYLFLHLHNMPAQVNQGLKNSLMRKRKVLHLLITDESKPTEADIKNAPNWLHNASESTPEHLAALLYQKYASPWYKSGIKNSPFLVGNLFTL